MNNIAVCFPYKDHFDPVFQIINDVAVQHKMNGIRIDKIMPLSKPVFEEIYQKIRESRLIIADITGNNPNVLNEVGIAQALGKPLLLITQDRLNGDGVPFNLRNL